MKHTIINALFLSAAIACISCEDMLDYQPKAVSYTHLTLPTT